MHVQMQGVPTSITLIIDYIMYSRCLYASTNFSVAIRTQFTYLCGFYEPLHCTPYCLGQCATLYPSAVVGAVKSTAPPPNLEDTPLREPLKEIYCVGHFKLSQRLRHLHDASPVPEGRTHGKLYNVMYPQTLSSCTPSQAHPSSSPHCTSYICSAAHIVGFKLLRGGWELPTNTLKLPPQKFPRTI